jgi:hypothetical protein
MRPCLLQEAQTRDDTVIEAHQFGLGQPVDINPHWGLAAAVSVRAEQYPPAGPQSATPRIGMTGAAGRVRALTCSASDGRPMPTAAAEPAAYLNNWRPFMRVPCTDTG